MLVSMTFSCANKTAKKDITTTETTPIAAKTEMTRQNIIKTFKVTTKSPIKRKNIVNLEYTLNKKADSASIKINDRVINVDLTKENIELETTDNDKLGTTVVALNVYSDGESNSKNTSFKLLPDNEPKEYKMVVKSTLPHSSKAYTQGLEFYNGKLYESSGQYNQSYVEVFDFPSLKSVKKEFLDIDIFAEGLTFLNDKLYLLTWKENKAFMLNPQTLKTEKEFTITTEGWGITTDGEFLYMSDGTEYIYRISPTDFKIIDYIEVLTPDGPINSINEMEWINGEIWANVYGYDVILRINPKSGEVNGIVRVPQLLTSAETTQTTDVFNGIAYDKTNNKIYVTGKNWPKIFEIEVIKQ